jgi:hypothetical protein
MDPVAAAAEDGGGGRRRGRAAHEPQVGVLRRPRSQ